MNQLKIMKKVFIVLLLTVLSVSFAFAETLTFQWNQDNTTNLKEWRLYWSDSPNGPYDVQEVAIIPYTASGGPVYTSPVTPAEVSGEQGTFVKKYFVLVACGDLPQPDGTTEYECSENSNEVTHDFWIPAGKFSVPVEFQIITMP